MEVDGSDDSPPKKKTLPGGWGNTSIDGFVLPPLLRWF